MTLTIQAPTVTDQTKLLAVSTRGDRAFGNQLGGHFPADALELDLHGKAHRGRWAVQLDDVLLHRDDPVIIVAQGVSCLAVAWWSQLSPRSYLRNVTGVIFMAPLSFTPSEADVARSLRPSPGTKLPFPSIVVSGASPIIDQVLELADSWGSRFVEASAQKRAPWDDRTPAEEALLRTFETLVGPTPDRAPISWWSDEAEQQLLAAG
jgi:predicted alpha/beta hydrolase family esterase